ncbi:MAG: hypothetical protein Q9159_006645 [Coniocarpon cinnabarinum]
MKAVLAATTGFFAAAALAVPSNLFRHENIVHRHEHLRRQDAGSQPASSEPGVAYTVQIVTATHVDYVDANGNPVAEPTPAPAVSDDGPQAADFSALARVAPQSFGDNAQNGNGKFATTVTAANGQQFSALAWNWGSPGGAHGVQWSYNVPAAQQTAEPSYYQPEQQQSESVQPVAQPSTYQPVQSQSPAQYSSTPSATGSGSAPANSGSTDFQKTVVDAHNLHRRNHSTPEIQWSDGLAKAAQMVADKCNFNHDVKTGLDVSGFQSYGQNFACTSGSDNIATDISQEWYAEEGIYELSGSYGQANPIPYTVNGEEAETGHFTQLVWAGSTHVGCAVGNCPNGVTGAGSMMKSLTVCDYGPAGNMMGDFAKNVPKGGAAS